MDRTVFDQSRMLIVYADGTTVGLCSIHCAAADMKQNKDKQVRSLMVADYTTKDLTDARTATWVMGGGKQGVMTSVAKWAFAKEEAARKFVQENGGKVVPFDQAMKAAEEEIGGGEKAHEGHMHAGHNMGQQPDAI
jgi:nitrous oxide reductase accessory protein NosL